MCGRFELVSNMLFRTITHLFCMIAVTLCVATPARVLAADEVFLPPEKAFIMRADMAAPDLVNLRFRIEPGYYMYRERFSIAADTDQVKVGEPRFPVGKIKFDPTFNKEMELYFSDIVIQLPLSAWPAGTAARPITLTVTGQGCAVAGLCYPPMDFVVRLAVSAESQGYTVQGQSAQSLLDRLSQAQWSEVLFGADDVGLAGLLSSTGLLEIAALFFVLGVLLALTPCVLPMVPILSVLLVGEQHHVSRSRGLVLSAAYVVGMSVVYTALGIAAGLSGAGLAAWLQTPWVLGAFGLLLGTLALAMFDVFQFQLPVGIQSRLMAANSSILGGRAVAAMLMGAMSALIVGPCVAAPLAGALLYISQTGDVVLGGIALFAMSWGMGVPLLLMGASAGKLMPRTGAWMEGVKKFFGVLLLGTAWWMVMPLLPTWLQIMGWAVLAMFSAVLLRTFDTLPEGTGFGGWLRKTVGLLLALLCAIWMVGVASGGRSLLQPLLHLARDTAAAPVSMAAGNSQNAQGALPVSGSPLSQDPVPATGSPSSARQQLLGNAGSAPAAAHLQFQRVRSVAELDAWIAQSTRPVMLDFYADWCVSCKEMESFTFPDPKVAHRMRQMLLLQADVTANNPDDRALLKRFKLFGPPGIIFFAAGGAERRDVRAVGFQDAVRFAATLDRVIK